MKKVILILGMILGSQVYAQSEDVTPPYTLKNRQGCTMTVHALSYEGFADDGLQSTPLSAEVSLGSLPGVIFQVEYRGGVYRSVDKKTSLSLTLFGKRSRSDVAFDGISYLVSNHAEQFREACRGLRLKIPKPLPPKRRPRHPRR